MACDRTGRGWFGSRGFLLSLLLVMGMIHPLDARGRNAARIDPENVVWLEKGIRDRQAHLCYLEVDPSAAGWFAMDITSPQGMEEACKRRSVHSSSLIIPVFPSVYSPGVNLDSDKPYYDAILESAGIRKGDKILVVGSGTGADAWAAWLKCGVEVYAVDINPVAVANTIETARLAGFPVRAHTADIIRDQLPDGYSSFDFVVWNMPMLNEPDYRLDRPAELSHDGDDGALFDGFMRLLPVLLRPSGKAVIWNSLRATERIIYPKQVFPFGKLAVAIITIGGN